MTRKGEPVYEKHVPMVGKKYRVKNGKYTGHWCKCMEFAPLHSFAIVMFLDSWGKDTKIKDAIPLKFLELV